MRVGFVHGVMNTDNLSILGLTIDYGPYGWLDDYDPEWTPNTTDSQQKRYRYSQQPNIALWNLYQLANSLYPLIEDAKPLESALAQFQDDYMQQWREMMAQKLGLNQFEEGDEVLFSELEQVLVATETDMTIFYRLLSNVERASYDDLREAFYEPDNHASEYIKQLGGWLDSYYSRTEKDERGFSERQKAMNQVNPKYVFRNYLAQQAIDLAEKGDYSMVNELLDVLREPYAEQIDKSHYAVKRPDWARTKVGCSMLSCSS